MKVATTSYDAVSPKSVQLFRCIHNTTYHACILPRFNPCSRERGLCYAGFSQPPTITAKPAIPLIITHWSPRVEPNCGFLGVSGAETYEESPLMDNKEPADWLQTTQKGTCGFHMNINVILTGNVPQESAGKRQQKRPNEWNGGRINEGEGAGGLRTPVRFTPLNHLKHPLVTTERWAGASTVLS